MTWATVSTVDGVEATAFASVFSAPTAAETPKTMQVKIADARRIGGYLVAETSGMGRFSVAGGKERDLVTKADAFATSADRARLTDVPGSAGFLDRRRGLDVVPVFRVPQREAIVDPLGESV